VGTISRFVVRFAVVASLAALATPTFAQTTLLDLTDPASGTSTYQLQFVATQASTTLSVAGYQVPSFEQVAYNDLFQNGVGTNLLVQTWGYIPSQQGSLSVQYNDGTAVNALDFGGVVVGYYDTYFQTFSTIVGDTYTYDFTFDEDYIGPSSLLVTLDSGTSVVPEPASLGALIVGLGMVGYFRRRRAI